MLTAAAVVAAALVVAACDSSAASPQLVDGGKPPKQASGAVRDDVDSLEKSPPGIASSSETAVRKEVTLEAQPWTVAHTVNPAGSFSLVRNTSTPASGDQLHVSIAGGEDRVLAPRATTAWNCNLIDEDARVSVRTDLGATVYTAPIKCGDALYVGSALSE